MLYSQQELNDQKLMEYLEKQLQDEVSTLYKPVRNDPQTERDVRIPPIMWSLMEG